MPERRRSLLGLVPFLIAVGAVSATGTLFSPGAWYASLELPPWTPPNWVFPPVWTVLYLAIAVAGWTLWATPGTHTARALWVLQLVLNGLWSWLFFGLHWVGVALLDLSALTVVIAVLLVLNWRTRRSVVWLLAPYGLWVLYAKSLNVGIILLN